MSEVEIDLCRIGEDTFADDVSDEALERASGTGALPTLIYGSYCFTCRLDEVRRYAQQS